MRQQNSYRISRIAGPAWRQAVNSVFGAARRLHEYRDARDVLLQYALHDQECHSRHSSCGEQC